VSLVRPLLLAALPVALRAGDASGVPADGGDRRLFSSDMAPMLGLGAQDPAPGLAPGRWAWMTMGVVRLAYNRQGGPSGATALESSNWAMGMGQLRLGGGLFSLMAMASLEPATIRGPGSPQLFQTGETWDGEPLVDRQHPHDFVMNLSATYRLGLGGAAALWLQAAPRGEPALGPTAFMHRASAGDNPSPPLAHHWQDSTHITSSVVTLGGAWRAFTLEASAFHGREPDEGRWDLDPGGLDSVSLRLKASLPRGWSAQASWGHLNEPEALVFGDARRATASFHYGAAGDRPLALTLAYGRNEETAHPATNSILLEGAWQATPRDQAFFRGEWVEKDAQLLSAKGFPLGGGEAGADSVLALTLGYARGIARLGGLEGALGGDVTGYAMRERLEPFYGRRPVSFHVFLRARWGRHKPGMHHGH
jgi:hypothetical protein